MPTRSIGSIAGEIRAQMEKAADPSVPAAIRRASAQYGSNCIPECPLCHGYGWISQDVAVSDPRFGKLARCPNAQALVDYSRSGLADADRGLAWDAIRDENNALAVMRQVRSALLAGRGWVYLWGSPGLAKTILLKVAVAEALRLGREAAFVQASDLISNLRAAYDDANPSLEAAARFEYWAGLPVLAIDELDKVAETAWVRQMRFSLLNRRYEDGCRGESFTLIASQLPPSALPEELASRVNDGRFLVLRVDGEDRRPFEYWYQE